MIDDTAATDTSTDDDHTICRARIAPMAPFDLHECRFPGTWVGVTDCVYADVVHGNWMEGYQMSFTALDTGAMQVVIEEGQCDHDRCIDAYETRLRALYDEPAPADTDPPSNHCSSHYDNDPTDDRR